MRLVDADALLKYLNDMWLGATPSDTDDNETTKERMAICLGIDECIGAVRSFQSANEWISVKDRLPDTDGEYLIFSNGYVGILPPCISTALFAKSLRGKCLQWDEPDRAGFYNWDSEGEWEETGVTHWLPLPEPPQEEAE